MSSTVLVLGAGGFIGRQLVQRLAAEGARVIAATRRPVDFPNPAIENAIADYSEAEHFGRWLHQCDAIVHAASASTPGSSAAQPQLDGNLRTTLALIEALQDSPACQLLYISSGGTLYGDRDRPAHEDDPPRPRSYHGAGKAAAEHFIHAWATQYEGAAVLLRPSNVYGPGQAPRQGFGIIPAAFDCAVQGTPLTIWGDGSAVRDYLYIDDFVALCSAVLWKKPIIGSRVFNAASSETQSLNALLDQIDIITNMPVRREFRPARRVDVHNISADTTAARSTFGWSPAVALDEGLRRTWQWFSSRA